MLHVCLHTSIPLDKVDNTPCGKASVPHVTFPGRKQTFLLSSEFITLCLQLASPVHFDFCPVTQSLSRYTSSQSTDFRKSKSPQTCNWEQAIFLCWVFNDIKFSRTLSPLVMAYIFLLVNRSLLELKCEDRSNSAHSFLSSTGTFDIPLNFFWHCIRFAWQEFGSNRTTEVTFVRSCHKLPLCPTEVMLWETDPLLAQSEPISNNSRALGITDLKCEKQKHLWKCKEWTENMWQQHPCRS